MSKYEDFQEIAHCGGKVTFQIVRELDGSLRYSQGFSHSGPGPASIVGIYADGLTGRPVGDFRFGGIGQSFDPPTPVGAAPVFLASDSQSCWAHQCPRCKGYFRNGTHPSIFPLTCPYCALKATAFVFLTDSQRAYVKHYIETLSAGLEAEIKPGTDKEIIIDMDEIAKLGSEVVKPSFYYASETQQTRYSCVKCGGFNDIRGVYGYCAACGWRNNVSSLQQAFQDIRARLNAGDTKPEEAVKLAVSEFDASCRDMAVQVRNRIPMKPGRRNDLERLVFHDVESPTIIAMKSMFDVDILRGVDEGIPFAKMMMHRRHVFEHNAGVADKRYVDLSGDEQAREGVLIRESRENAHRLIDILGRMANNFHEDFHEIFPPTKWPVDNFEERQERKKARGQRRGPSRHASVGEQEGG